VYLAIDNCTNFASVCLYDSNILYENTWLAKEQHTTTTLPTIEKAMLSLGRNFNELKGIVCAKGPGSFNGARAGMSLGIGLGMSLNIPVVFVSAMEENALPFKDSGLNIICLMDAGRGEIYTATYQSLNDRLTIIQEEHISTLNEILYKITCPTIFCGEYVNQTSTSIKEKLGSMAIIATFAQNIRRASFLIEAGLPKLQEAQDEVPAPLYLRKPPITLSNKTVGLPKQDN